MPGANTRYPPTTARHSTRNLLFMRRFAEEFRDEAIVKQLVSQLPWGHVVRQPTIGLLLCRSKRQVVVEYALRDLKKPIGVATWETRLAKELPEVFAGSLPSVEELEAELGGGT